METTKEQVISLLKALGDSGDEVAESLTKLGIMGSPCSSFACPIAKYLLKVGIATNVSRNGVSPRHSNDWWHISFIEVRAFDRAFDRTFDGISEFIRRFDSGNYPKCRRAQ